MLLVGPPKDVIEENADLWFKGLEIFGKKTTELFVEIVPASFCCDELEEWYASTLNQETITIKTTILKQAQSVTFSFLLHNYKQKKGLLQKSIQPVNGKQGLQHDGLPEAVGMQTTIAV
jgi:hypothetical protein